MKVIFQEYNLVIPFLENRISVLTVENPRALLNILQMIDWQMNGGEGKILLAEDDNILSWGSCVEIIWNPLQVDFTSKRIINKLYQEMKNVSGEECIQDFYGVRQALGRYLNLLSMKLPYNISYNVEMDNTAIFKLCGVQMESEGLDTLQKLVEYIKICSMLCAIRVVILVNIKSYLDEDQLKELYQQAFYYKIYILAIESSQREILEWEKHYILDRMDCLIEL